MAQANLAWVPHGVRAIGNATCLAGLGSSISPFAPQGAMGVCVCAAQRNVDFLCSARTYILDIKIGHPTLAAEAGSSENMACRDFSGSVRFHTVEILCWEILLKIQ